MSALIKTYLKQIAAIAARGDQATEFSYRTPIETLLKNTVAELAEATASDNAAEILQEPSRTQHIGAPDFRITAKSGGIIGYVECKKPDANLRAATTKAQIARYRALSSNIMLTDSWRWHLLRNGKPIKEITLGENPSQNTQTEFTELLRIFFTAQVEKIGAAKLLAEALAGRCVILSRGLKTHENDSTQFRLHGLFESFKTALDANLKFPAFADTFAQTLVYCLLLAKLKAPLSSKLDLYNINRHIPANFALIREIALFMQEFSDRRYQNIKWVIDDILAIVNNMDAAAVTESMSYKNSNFYTDQDDPYIYFYENFLAAYDAKQRERRGVYYTPPPVVKFIVTAVDDILKTEFSLPQGLAQTESVTALDFAAGTGTFMLEMMRAVFAEQAPARRNMLTREHLLKNFYGFELLMAPYVIAHLKLSQFLADNEMPLQDGERIQIYLANTLEEIDQRIHIPFLPNLAEDANQAQEIKDQPVLVIVGNPPYSVVSQNNGDWIKELIKTYQSMHGAKLKEANLKVLQDDYVKFIRFAQWKMDQVEHGMVAIITNHGFLDNPTFRGLRWNLMQTFDALYFLDLHGNVKKKETAPDGGKDENVFDIQQGVAISIMIKNPHAKNKGVFRADLYGKRNEKYQACMQQTMQNIHWKKLTPTAPFYLFIPYDHQAAEKYNQFYSLKDMFAAQSTGIKSHRDHFAFAFTAEEMKNRITDMLDTKLSTEQLREKYNLKDTRDWNLKTARTALQQSHSFAEFLKPCSYRPFDMRWCYYGKETMELHRPEVMGNMLAGNNFGLVSVRQVKAGKTWQHCLIAENIAECTFASNKTSEAAYLFPLYRYDTVLEATAPESSTAAPRTKLVTVENFTQPFRRWLDEKYGVSHPPESILACIYAILHSPDYRKRNAQFLRIDYPRIPFPDTTAEFTRLATIGEQLINAHLLRTHGQSNLAQHKGSGTTHLVEKVRYDEKTERLYFNQTEYFAPIPEAVFNFQIGGYQPLDKYLKSRKSRPLTLPETETLRKATHAIAFTIEKMQELDG